MDKKYELQSIYSNCKSFYGKAEVEIEEDNIVKVLKLYSYNTLVAIVTYDNMSSMVQYDCLGKFSQTTRRHQKEFFKQNGLSDKDINILFDTKNNINHIEKKED